MEYDDEEYAEKAAVEAFLAKKQRSLTDAVPRRLNGRCKGLLEISKGRVEFLHRTDIMEGINSAKIG